MAIEIIKISVFIIAGMLLLFYSGKILVSGAASFALRFGISELTVGMTVIAIGTSSPEAFVSINAAIKGSSGITIGNVLGSNIANIGIALGIASVIRSIETQKSFFRIDLPFMLLSIAVLIGLTMDRFISRTDGFILLAIMVLFIIYCIRASNNSKKEQVPVDKTSLLKSIFHDIIFMILGFAGLSYGSDIFVDGASNLASMLGGSEFMIGLTVVAIGTSLPEIATLVIASLSGKSAIAIGTIIGSNIFNILLVLGVSGVINPVKIPENSYFADVFIMLGFTVAAALLSFFGREINRIDGIVLLSGYAAYIAFLILKASY